MDYNFEILSLLDNSIEFEKLHSKFNRFNPFKILKVDKFEIRHSNMIAWLLDPMENHHLGSMFVNKILSRTFVKAENEELIGQYNFIKLHKQSLQDLEVFREVQTKNNKRIDILAISEAQKVAILIENKYKSLESDGQLQNYINFVSEKYEGYTIIPIFLSLDGSAPSHKSYLTLDYGDILNILKGQLEIYSDYTSSTIKDFLSYYIDILEGELVRDEEDISAKGRGGKVGSGVSGGEESLSSLLFALALLQTIEASPGYIILDEYDSALDDSRKEKVFTLFEQELNRKMIIVSSKSHDPNYLQHFSQALTVMHDASVPISRILQVKRAIEETETVSKDN
ncbi:MULTISPECIES: PD-(D/E)XK nuclease family protein [Bacillus cereus group]|uniref:PD-(D/E)XK nuclease family protein n=1 Tax=Bacillus TaxID=1386 RepID=UPI0009D8561E|nr:hypothetical protein CON04_30675 [Bacillus cereus]PEC27534.1 hypothetical protein CON75_13435 [Bacillus thuringiensis]PEQ71478.1 hypothetical protein CN478_28075 [Bacillus cereus]PFZ17444.1 hypothetical protein COL73_22800 [Bacillus thuringiensis]SMD40403.1 PD-(D/E)XK nuclease superfamily protein [Bacillus sp. JKS001846]